MTCSLVSYSIKFALIEGTYLSELGIIRDYKYFSVNGKGQILTAVWVAPFAVDVVEGGAEVDGAEVGAGAEVELPLVMNEL